jgi:hypothetical protein
MIRRLTTIAAALVVALSVTACSADGTPNQGPSPGAANGGQGNQGVPDACGLITTQQLSQLLGQPAGTGTSTSVSPERSVCVYDGGFITAVEVASHYQGSRDSIDEMSTTTDVPGVGKGAFYDANGQLIATGDRVFVAVTAAGVAIPQLVEVVKIMLANAGEAA